MKERVCCCLSPSRRSPCSLNSIHELKLKLWMRRYLGTKNSINLLQCFLATKRSSVIVRMPLRQVLGCCFVRTAAKINPQTACFAPLMHGDWGLTLALKHEEHIAILFSAQCYCSTSISLPQGQGPKTFDPAKNWPKNNNIHMEPKVFSLWHARNFFT